MIWIDWKTYIIIIIIIDNKINFNQEKCKVLHLGIKNEKHKYKMGDIWLHSSPCERDLGVLVNNKVNISQQCDMAAKKANAILGCIGRSIESRTVVANLWHACQRWHSEPFLWAHAPWPQHRVHQSSLLESQRNAGLGSTRA